MKTLNCMHISDTHEENVFEIVADSWSETKSAPIDILFISGDLTYKGKLDKLKQLHEELEYLLMNHIVKEVFVIPGNHDLSFEKTIGYESKENAMAIFSKNPKIHLVIHGAKTIQGLKIFGSAWTPYFHNWAFNYHDIRAKELWDQIPQDTQVLVTHGPPRFILDEVVDYMNIRHTGCPVLANKIEKLPILQFHLFGHIHQGYGIKKLHGITYLNSSIMDERYRPTNKPQYFEVKVYDD